MKHETKWLMIGMVYSSHPGKVPKVCFFPLLNHSLVSGNMLNMNGGGDQ